MIWWDTYSDFYRYLINKGATLDGVTGDDSAAIMSAIDEFSFYQRGKLTFPPSLSMRIDEEISVPSGRVAIDWNGGLLNASLLTSGRALSVMQEAGGYPWGYSYSMAMENFNLIGSQDAAVNADGLFIGSVGGNGRVTGQALRNFLVRGFRDAITIGDQAYINCIDNGNVEYAWRRGINYEAVMNAGEALNWNGGRFANCRDSRPGNNGTAIYMADLDSGENELILHGTSVDYSDILVDVRGGIVEGHGCHFEDDGSTLPMFKVDVASSKIPSGIALHGGTIAPRNGTRPSLITMAGDKAFFNARSKFDTYDCSSEVLTVLSGAPRYSFVGSQFDTGGLTRFINLGSATNRLANGSFSLGTLASWANSGAPFAFSADSIVKPAGANYSARMIGSGGGNGYIRQTVPCIPGQAVSVRAMVHVPTLSAGSVFLRLSFCNEDLSVTLLKYDLFNIASTTADFVLKQAMKAAPPETQRVIFDMYGFGFVGTAHLAKAHLQVI